MHACSCTGELLLLLLLKGARNVHVHLGRVHLVRTS